MRKIMATLHPIPFDEAARDQERDGNIPSISVLKPSEKPRAGQTHDVDYVLRFEGFGAGDWEFPVSQIIAHLMSAFEK